MRPEKTSFGNHRVPVPADGSLSGLASLLDAGRMGAAAGERLLPADVQVRECHPLYVRYKPETNCIAAYELHYTDALGAAATLRFHGKCSTAADHGPFVEKLATKRWIEPDGIRPYAHLEAERTVLFAFPNDPGLDGLRLLSHPKKIQRALYDHAVLDPADAWRISDRRLTLTTVRHKPEKRAVTRVDTRAVHRASGEKRAVRVYLRTYQDDRGAAMHALMQYLSGALGGAGDVAVPRSIAYLGDRRTLMVGDVPGAALAGELAGPDPSTALIRTAAALSRLHACTPAAAAPRSIAELLADARDTGRTLTQLLPELSGEIEALLAGLGARAREMMPVMSGFVHGDFHPDQVLVQDDRAALLDFDRLHVGDPLADVGNFRANLLLLGRRGALEDVEALADRFDDAYAVATGMRLPPARHRFWTAYGLFQLTVSPFRRLSASWPAEVADLVATCWGVLS